MGPVFAEVDSVELVAEVDPVELVVLFRHSSSSSTAMTHLQLKVRKPALKRDLRHFVEMIFRETVDLQAAMSANLLL